MLVIKNLKYRIGVKDLYDDLNITLGNNQKVGLIGANGCGKSTLFKLILGEIKADEGLIQMENESVGYLPQLLELPLNLMVGEFIESLIPNSWEQYKADEILNKLEFKNFDEYQIIETLSEGQKMKLKLCEILLEEPTILLLDEPTNHLDLKGIEMFETFVKRFKGIVVMVSHDRQFLNNTVDKIIEIEQGRSLVFEGNYDDYKLGKEDWIEKNLQNYHLYTKKKKQLETLIEHAKKIKDSQKRGKAVKAARTRYKREIEDSETFLYQEEKIENLKFSGQVPPSKLILRCQNINKAYKSNTVLKDFDLELRGRERVWLSGPNGTGKSTLVKCIMNQEKIDSGEITLGNNVNIGYFAQIPDKAINNYKVHDYFTDQTKVSWQSGFGVLQKFLFNKTTINRSIGSLSPGERARLLFAIFIQNQYELLILDEPTNHLDINTKELIEDALNDYNGSVLLVSHDRYFVEKSGMETQIDLQTRQIKRICG